MSNDQREKDLLTNSKADRVYSETSDMRTAACILNIRHTRIDSVECPRSFAAGLRRSLRPIATSIAGTSDNIVITNDDGTPMRCGHIPRAAFAHRRPRPSCRQRRLCPMLRIGQSRRWPSVVGLWL